MTINCENIRTLPYANKLKIVAGKKGMERSIKWVHFMENPGYIRWLKGGELILITGILIKDNEDTLYKLIQDLNSKNIAGLVINVGPYISSTPKKIIELADLLNFPIFELPFQVRLIDISQSICKAIFMDKMEQESMNSFMRSVIFGDSNYDQDEVNKAKFYKYNPNKTYCSMVISMDNFVNIVKHEGIWNEDMEFRTRQQLEQIIINIMHKLNKKYISITEDTFVIVMFPVEDDEKDKINLIAEEILDNVNLKIKGLKISIGIGSCWKQLKDLRGSVDKAQNALKVLKVSKNKICNYKDIGMYRLLFQMDKEDEMKELCEEILGELIRYDNKNSTSLVETLEVYMDENCNLVQAADELFIHKNTLKYRIKRIEEISNCDLRNIDHLFSFNIAFKIRKFLACIK
ncbi:PucR family transcriptional regulator [Clostridium sp. WILCCON 0269]|uniref:PucR family transcriptional regulator n=1 Tax=Candidatus Clostridium eludens TaxID=3381663 RepID=A0ABW8SEC6_9CLOT